jgi:catechol 2,3-dioxygenase
MLGNSAWEPQARAGFATQRVRDQLARRNDGDTGDETPAGIRLGHVHLKVCRLERSVPFYTDVLGLRLTERTGRYAFLAVGAEHHSVALEELGVWTVRPSRRALGVAHVAFEVPDRTAFVTAHRRLLEAGVPIIARDNGISWTFRFRDPDGNEIEIYLDRRDAPGGTQRWEGRCDGPLGARQPVAPALWDAVAFRVAPKDAVYRAR